MDFAQWLHGELEARGWTQNHLVKRSSMAGYRISQAQLSHILSGARQAGPDACIALAYALGIPREEVFRARGWLLREPEKLFQPESPPKLVHIVHQLEALPPDVRESALDAVLALIHLIYQFHPHPDRNSSDT